MGKYGQHWRLVMAQDDLAVLMQQVRACTLCEELPLGPKPILQASYSAPILIVGQAPGRITHEKGIPFDDPSGNRLRQWLGVTREEFYDAAKFNIIPMGFCFPGSGKGGDQPPRPECAKTWRHKLLSKMPQPDLTLVLGQYAQDWHLKGHGKKTLTELVKSWQHYWPNRLPLPHPSPRNLRWFKANPWFEADIVPVLQQRVRLLLDAPKKN